VDKLDILVERVTAFFCKVLPTSRLNIPPTKLAISKAFDEAEYCYQVASPDKLPAACRPVLDELKMKWPMWQAPKLLLLALADNVRINSSLMILARQNFDKITSENDKWTEDQIDLDSWVFVQQRNLIREQFVACGSLLKEASKENDVNSDWQQLKSFICLSELASRGNERMEVDMNKLITSGRLDKLIRGLLIKEPQLSIVQNWLLVTLQNKLDIKMLLEIDPKLLALVCIERKEMVGIIAKLVWRTTEGNDQGTLQVVGQMVAKVLQASADPNIILDKLEEQFRIDSYGKSEIINIIAAYLRTNKSL